jgi:hypothetical protein
MTEPASEPPQSFAEYLASLSPDELARINEEQRAEAAEEHKQFTEAFRAGQCNFCGDALTIFSSERPCRHWLLKPEGVRKEHIEQIAEQFSWMILENYLRWVANEEAFAKNINDLCQSASNFGSDAISMIFTAAHVAPINLA